MTGPQPAGMDQPGAPPIGIGGPVSGDVRRLHSLAIEAFEVRIDWHSLPGTSTLE